MYSDDEYFLATNGIGIFNDRNDEDFAVVNDIFCEGM